MKLAKIGVHRIRLSLHKVYLPLSSFWVKVTGYRPPITGLTRQIFEQTRPDEANCKDAAGERTRTGHAMDGI